MGRNKKYLYVAAMLALILAAGMGLTQLYVMHSGGEEEVHEFSVVTSFYPMYIAAANVTAGLSDVSLKNLSEPQTGCLHDFQLTPEDMKLLGAADVFIINGGGIEAFMDEAMAACPNLTVIEACEYLELLNDGGEYNAHAWMSVGLYREMVQTIADELGNADPAHRGSYLRNAAAYDEKLAVLQERFSALHAAAKGQDVILFHEAFDYVAADCGLIVRAVMDLDEERQISAGEVAGIVGKVKEDGVSLILAEELYGKDMADAVCAEADADVLYLDPLNRGSYERDSYLIGMERNIASLEGYFERAGHAQDY